jgi:sugar phosphate isomerase/epimerase
LTTFTLGLNLICAANRFPEPEAWSRLAREELDLDFIQFSADVLDPMYPEEYIQNYLQRTKSCLQQYNLVVDSVFMGMYSRRNMLLHPDQGGRNYWFAWYQALIRMAAFLGARSVGTHFGTLSVRDSASPDAVKQRVDEAVRGWQELTHLGRDLGLDHFFIETMSIPREMPSTIAGARQLYQQLNAKAALPIRLCLDVGHAPHPAERDPYSWLRELSPYSAMVHLQQSDENHSRHWPFTAEYNALGKVEPQKVLETISSTGVKEMPLFFEIFHRETYEQEQRVIPELKESVAYWRKSFMKYQETRL